MPIFKKRKKQENNLSNDWLSYSNEGELAIDAYETDKEFIICSTIAGVKAKDLDISLEEDMLIIKGHREKPEDSDEKKSYIQQECFWGPFSKKIILPEKVDISQAKATIKEGILFLRIPKEKKGDANKIKIN